ncbi:hypothetical protein [Streptomyces lanatus]|uniref:Uncharacterized protein n=1 Tax=Streptomyces lanatus TaxID=66900 RepID=A0ABV1Y2M7_9ACTN|nr:hypothetical protein [Streptomyces lanatus]
MATNTLTRRRLHQLFASLVWARRTPSAPGDEPTTPDVWLAGLRLGG